MYIRILTLDLLYKLKIFSQFVVKLLTLLIILFAMQVLKNFMWQNLSFLFYGSAHEVIVRKAFTFYSEVNLKTFSTFFFFTKM